MPGVILLPVKKATSPRTDAGGLGRLRGSGHGRAAAGRGSGATGGYGAGAYLYTDNTLATPISTVGGSSAVNWSLPTFGVSNRSKPLR